MRTSVWASLPLALFTTVIAGAQPASEPTATSSAKEPVDSGEAEPDEVEDAAQPAGEPSDEEPSSRKSAPEDTLEVDDPMLVPVPPPKKVLTDWREALELVRTQSTDYIQAQAQVEAARGQSRMALASVLPTLTGTANAQRHLIREEKLFGGQVINAPDPAGSWTVNATLRVPLLDVRNWYDYATTRAEIKQREMTRDDAERLIIGGLAQAMVTVVTAERLSEVTRVNLAAALSTLDLNKRRARLGAGSAVDVLRSKQEVVRSRAQVVDADESLRQAREALGQALGLIEPVGITPDLKMDQLRQDARDTCAPGEDPLDRADVRAAAAGAAIAKRNVKSVSYSFLPTIDGTSTVQRLSGVNPFFPDTTWTIGATLTWRLYDGGLRYGEKRLNRALLAQAEETARNTGRLAAIEAVQAARGVQVAQKSLDIAEESRAIAKDNAQLARAKFINGSGTSFDMVDTQSTARQAELDVTVKEFELLRAEIIAFLALASCDL